MRSLRASRRRKPEPITIPVARSVEEIEVIRKWFEREHIPATAYRAGSKVMIVPRRELTVRQYHEAIGIVADDDLEEAFERNLPPKVHYHTHDGVRNRWVLARCASEAKAKFEAYGLLRVEMPTPIWLL